jgi:hypothetical protein
MNGIVRAALSVLVLGAAVALPATADAKGPKAAKPAADAGAMFNKDAALTALKSVDLVKCKVSGGPRGEGHVTVTFAPSGAATGAAVDRGPFVKSPVERCIVAAYKKASVPAFKGDAVSVGKSFRID